ncbi:serine hydrolase domain-containing protein [Nonomuraea typhae]|uniref:serine hydrolase domain-containing protein n=1 Tax=Nonomuraea typhae TaxID=2603600 RepID=UPI0012FBFB0E|nr:serine hydrolase domain-containing protein [Nonomuraea typhae]
MYCDPRFSRVREVFEGQFADGEELGAAFAVYLDGELVVDLWAGVADRRTGRAWEADTPAFAYSCTKALTAAVALGVIDDVTSPVTRFWPEFATPATTVEHLLAHQAGLPVVEDPVPVEEFADLPAIADRLARQRPLWEPGTAHGYHALTYGFLVGEVVRRITGTSIGDLVAAQIAGPHDLDLWVGASEEVITRAARLTTTPPEGRAPATGGTAPAARGTAPAAGGTAPAVTGAAPAAAMPADSPAALAALDPGSLMNRALGNPGMHLLKGGANHPVILRAGWPGAGVVTTAKGLAGFYRALIGGELLPHDRLREAVRRRVDGQDRVLLMDSAFGLGFARPSSTFLAPPKAAEAFGHGGLGGSLGLGDPSRGLACAYVMNRLAGSVTGSLRAHRLISAVYDAL